MKLYQALKLKNKLAGEIKHLENFISSKNSNLIENTSKFDLTKLLADLSTKREELITLKVNINKTNQSVVKKIYTLSELKSEKQFWDILNTKEGKIAANSWDRTSSNEEYKAHFDEILAIAKKEELQNLIDKTQEELDYFNHTTDIGE